MGDTQRKPRGPDSEPSPEPGVAEAPAQHEEIDTPPEADRWEGEGGIAVEPPTAATTEPEPDYKDRWLRAEAELQNFRRRASREWDEARRAAEESVLLDVVAALDDLDRALDAARGSDVSDAWIEGVALVGQRLRDGLARRGVTVEDPKGRPFDPVLHEALLEVDAPAGTAPGTVVEVALKGYRRGARALRAARVVVARAPAGV